jgi:hypothetical protein
MSTIGLLEVNTLLQNKQDRATTISGYGITDCYTKQEIDSFGLTPKPQSVLCAMPNISGSEIGLTRWYPSENITLVDVFAYCGLSPDTNNLVFSVKKNGTVILENLVIQQNQNTSTITPCTVALTPTDYLTCDVNVGDETAKNAVIRISYLPSS